MGPDSLEISVTEFKAKCLKLITDVNEGRIREIILTRRGREVARLHRPSTQAGARADEKRASVRVLPGDDPSDGDWTYDWDNL